MTTSKYRIANSPVLSAPLKRDALSKRVRQFAIDLTDTLLKCDRITLLNLRSNSRALLQWEVSQKASDLSPAIFRLVLTKRTLRLEVLGFSAPGKRAWKAYAVLSPATITILHLPTLYPQDVAKTRAFLTGVQYQSDMRLQLPLGSWPAAKEEQPPRDYRLN